jgi:hypothetical protein
MARGHRLSLFFLFLILAVAIGFRFWRIGETPPGFHLDESFEGLEAWRILKDSDYRPVFIAANFGLPPLNAYANAVAFGLAELTGFLPGPTVMRVTAAVFGVLGVVAVAGAADELRRLDGDATRLSPAFPLFAAASLAVMRWHIHFSRMGIEPILTPLWWGAFIWLFLRGWRTGGWLAFLASGAALAACMYSYQGAWVMPFVALGVTALLGVKKIQAGASASSLGRPIAGCILAAATALLLVAPLAWFFWQNPGLLTLRPSQIAVVGGDASTSGGVIHNMWATAAMFWPLGATGDLDPRRNLPGESVLGLWLATPFFIGLVIAVLGIRRVVMQIILLSLIVLLSVGVASEYAPHFHRVLGAAGPAAILCAVGLDAIWQWRPARFQAVRWASIVLLVVAAFTSWQQYFVRWAALPDLYHAFDVGLWEVGRWIASQPAQTPIYLTPRSSDHPTLAFAWETQPDAHAAPVTFDGRNIFPLAAQPPTHPELYVVIEHEDFRTRLLLPDLFPTAQVTRAFVDAGGQTYANVYVRAAETDAQRPPFVEHNMDLGDGVALMGYDVQPAAVRPGDTLYVQYHWLATEKPVHDWTVFTHLVDPENGRTLLAGKDSPPGNGSLPTTRWQPGWRILDEYQMSLPADLPAGEYELEFGLYTADGDHLPMTGKPATLGVVTIE